MLYNSSQCRYGAKSSNTRYCLPWPDVEQSVYPFATAALKGSVPGLPAFQSAVSAGLEELLADLTIHAIAVAYVSCFPAAGNFAL